MNTEQLLEKMLENVRRGDEPVKDIQVTRNGEWKQLFNNDIENCLFGPVQFRTKPRTRNICGFDVPAPEVKEPAINGIYYTMNALNDNCVFAKSWADCAVDDNAFRNGLWLSEADAIANAKALRGENPYE